MSYRSALATTTLLTATLLTPASATAGAETCQGRSATIVGTGIAVDGTPGDDVIVTGASQIVRAGDGNDLICVSASVGDQIYIEAGPGNDSVDATMSTTRRTVGNLGVGLDRYVGGASSYDDVGADSADDHLEDTDGATLWITGPVTGSPGTYSGDSLMVWSATLGIQLELDDQLVVGGTHAATVAEFDDAVVFAPKVVLRGNADGNLLRARGCAIRIDGEGGDDYLESFAYVDQGEPTFTCSSSARLLGGAGDDALRGWRGKDRLVGNAGNDSLEGGEGSDLLFGGGGNDALDGENDGDVLRGNGGKDRLDGGKGRDHLWGNAGRDTANGDKGRDRCIAEVERHCEF